MASFSVPGAEYSKLRGIMVLTSFAMLLAVNGAAVVAERSHRFFREKILQIQAAEKRFKGHLGSSTFRRPGEHLISETCGKFFRTIPGHCRKASAFAGDQP
jgi:hypothetical protein